MKKCYYIFCNDSIKFLSAGLIGVHLFVIKLKKLRPLRLLPGAATAYCVCVYSNTVCGLAEGQICELEKPFELVSEPFNVCSIEIPVR